MNLPRLVVLGFAAIAAGGIALLAHGLLGGGTPKVIAHPAPLVSMAKVLVAAENLAPGQHLTGAQVRWQPWPKSSLDPNLMTQATAPNVDFALRGTVVRSPIVAGEPITEAKIVRTDASGLMAATVTPGMRALSMGVSTDTGAGGFILPNDRVDVIATVQISDMPKRFRTMTIIQNVRVLAMDQTYKEDKDQKVVIAKTATLELSPAQAELVAMASASGTLSLALRGLADSTASSLVASALLSSAMSTAEQGTVGVIRYGIGRSNANGGGGN
jgi:pilus assembly protein CpaB